MCVVYLIMNLAFASDRPLPGDYDTDPRTNRAHPRQDEWSQCLKKLLFQVIFPVVYLNRVVVFGDIELTAARLRMIVHDSEPKPNSAAESRRQVRCMAVSGAPMLTPWRAARRRCQFLRGVKFANAHNCTYRAAKAASVRTLPLLLPLLLFPKILLNF